MTSQNKAIRINTLIDILHSLFLYLLRSGNQEAPDGHSVSADCPVNKDNQLKKKSCFLFSLNHLS